MKGLNGRVLRSVVALSLPTVVVVALGIWFLVADVPVIVREEKARVHSSTERAAKAMRDDPTAAQTLGINLVSKKLSIFAFSAFFAGVGGGLYAHYLPTISSAAFSFTRSFAIVEISIIGGMGSLSGSFLGAIFYTIVPSLLQNLENGMVLFGTRLPQLFGLANIIMAAFIIILIIFRRQGLMGNSEIILDTYFRKSTYTALFKKGEWAKIPRYFADIPVRISAWSASRKKLRMEKKAP